MRPALVAAAGLGLVGATPALAPAQPASTLPAPPSAPAAEPWTGTPWERAAFGFLGIGPGVLVGDDGIDQAECPGCSHGAVGPAMRIWFGYMATDRLAPVVNVVFSGRGVDDPAGRYDLADQVHAEVGLRYWLGKRPWIELGAGAGAITLRDEQDPRVPPNSGALLGLAAGYEFAAWPTFSLLVVADAGVILGDEPALSAGLSLGLDWWYYDFAQ